MKLIDFVNSVEDWSGELINHTSYESRFGFEVCEGVVILSPYGKKVLGKVFNAEIKFIKTDVIQLEPCDVTDEEFEYFMSMWAGYESAEEYDKIFGE